MMPSSLMEALSHTWRSAAHSRKADSKGVSWFRMEGFRSLGFLESMIANCARLQLLSPPHLGSPSLSSLATSSCFAGRCGARSTCFIRHSAVYATCIVTLPNLRLHGAGSAAFRCGSARSTASVLASAACSEAAEAGSDAIQGLKSDELQPTSCTVATYGGPVFRRLSFWAPFFLAPFCFNAGKKERSDAYVERKQDRKL